MMEAIWAQSILLVKDFFLNNLSHFISDFPLPPTLPGFKNNIYYSFPHSYQFPPLPFSLRSIHPVFSVKRVGQPSAMNHTWVQDTIRQGTNLCIMMGKTILLKEKGLKSRQKSQRQPPFLLSGVAQNTKATAIKYMPSTYLRYM